MKKLYYCIIALLIITSCKTKKNTIFPLKKDITQAVYASGKVYPLQRRFLASKVAGYVAEIYVKAGDSVAAGTPLIAIRNDLVDVQLKTAANNLQTANNNASTNSAALRLAQEEVKAAQSKYALDSINYLRFKNLYEQNATARLNVEQSKTLADISKQNLEKAWLNLSNLQNKFNIELANAQSNYESQKIVKGDFVLYADNNLRIYDIKPKKGELVAPQLPLLEVGATRLFEVELAVDETDIGLIKTGQEVIYELGAVKGKFLKGSILQVYPTINPMNKTAKVIASLSYDSTINFFSGMSVEANIVIAQQKDALVVPKNYIFDNEYVKRSSDKQRIKIQKGIEDLQYVQILGGITEKEELTDELN